MMESKPVLFVAHLPFFFVLLCNCIVYHTVKYDRGFDHPLPKDIGYLGTFRKDRVQCNHGYPNPLWVTINLKSSGTTRGISLFLQVLHHFKTWSILDPIYCMLALNIWKTLIKHGQTMANFFRIAELPQWIAPKKDLDPTLFSWDSRDIERSVTSTPEKNGRCHGMPWLELITDLGKK